MPRLSTLLAVLLLAGTALLGVGAALHPVLTGRASDDLHLIATMPSWRAIHLVIRPIMLVTRDEQLAKRARYLTTQAKDDALEFVHGEVGFNYRLTNVQAAIGLAQLEQLMAFVAAKRRIAERYSRALSTLEGLQPMSEAPWARSAYWLYTVLLDARTCSLDRRQLLRALAERGIQTRPLWQPLHRSPAHASSFARPCPVADETQANALSLPCSTHLSEADQDRVIDSVASLLSSVRGGVI